MSHADFITSFPGLSEFQSGGYDRALPLLLPLAEQGHAEAQCIMGNIYHLGGVVPDLPSTIDWYSRASVQGYGVASSNLAGMYWVGAGVTADGDRAQQLYERAKVQGFTGM